MTPQETATRVGYYVPTYGNKRAWSKRVVSFDMDVAYQESSPVEVLRDDLEALGWRVGFGLECDLLQVPGLFDRGMHVVGDVRVGRVVGHGGR